MGMSLRRTGLLLLIAAAVFWSLGGLAVKLAKLDPFVFTFLRSAGAISVLVLFLPVSRGRRTGPVATVLTGALFAGVMLTLISAMTFSTAAMGILLQYTAPMFVALLCWLMYRRTITGPTAGALAISLGGVGVLIAGEPAGSGLAAPALGLLSGLLFAGLIVALERLERGLDGGETLAPLNRIQLNLLMNIVAACLLVGPALYFGLTDAPLASVAIAMGAGVVQIALPYYLFQLALRHVKAVDASLLTLLEPVLNPVWVALVVSEVPGPATYIGGVMILVALLVHALFSAEEPAIPQPQGP